MCEIHESYCTSQWNSRPKSFARINLPRWTSSAQPQRSKIWGSVSGGDRVARARCPRSSVEAGQKCIQIKGARKSNILLTFGKLVLSASNLKLEEREFVVDSGASMHVISKKDLRHFDEIVQSYDSHNRQWRSADAWRGNGVCQRIGYILDYESPRKHASSIVARKALRWKRKFLWMEQWSKTTSHSKREEDSMQHGELRSYCGSRLVKFVFWIFINFKDTFKTGDRSPNISFQLVYFTNHNCVKRQWDSSTGKPEWDRSHPPASVSSSRVERKERGDPLCSDIPEWLQEFREILVDDEIPVHGDSHANSSHEASLEPIFKRREDVGKHSVYTPVPKRPKLRDLKRTKITRAPCRRRNSGAVLRAENFGDLITADHKVLSDNCESRNNHRYAVVAQDSVTQWIQAYPCKTKTSQETQRSLQKFLEPERNPKVVHTDNSLEFGKACEALSWNHCTSTPQRSETNGIAERAVRRVKEGTFAVLLQSSLNESWWADSMECCTYRRNVTDLLSDGKTPYERRLRQPFKGPIIPFGSMVECCPISAKDQSRIHQFGMKVLLGLFLGYALYAEGIWKGDILVADVEELETMDASEIYSWARKCTATWCQPWQKSRQIGVTW